RSGDPESPEDGHGPGRESSLEVRRIPRGVRPKIVGPREAANTRPNARGPAADARRRRAAREDTEGVGVALDQPAARDSGSEDGSDLHASRPRADRIAARAGAYARSRAAAHAPRHPRPGARCASFHASAASMINPRSCLCWEVPGGPNWKNVSANSSFGG